MKTRNYLTFTISLVMVLLCSFVSLPSPVESLNEKLPNIGSILFIIFVGLIFLVVINIPNIFEGEFDNEMSKKIKAQYIWIPIVLFICIVYNEGIGREVITTREVTVEKIDSTIYRMVLEEGIHYNSIAREGSGGVKGLIVVDGSVETFNDKLKEIVSAAKQAAISKEKKIIAEKYYRRLWRLSPL